MQTTQNKKGKTGYENNHSIFHLNKYYLQTNLYNNDFEQRKIDFQEIFNLYQLNKSSEVLSWRQL